MAETGRRHHGRDGESKVTVEICPSTTPCFIRCWGQRSTLRGLFRGTIRGRCGYRISMRRWGWKRSATSRNWNGPSAFSDLVNSWIEHGHPIAVCLIYGYVIGMAKGAIALVYLIAAIGVIFTGNSYARMSEAFPLAGGPMHLYQGGWTGSSVFS